MAGQQNFELKSTSVEKVIDPLIDVGNLLIVDRDTIEGDASVNLLERARNNTQLLFNKIWELEKKSIDGVMTVELPQPNEKRIFRLPREKKLPEKREPTKWEKYAAEKGIVKRKKDKKVFDETSKEWKPTYGYNRGNDNTKDWMLEVPGGADPYKDYFAERAEKKKERIAKNEVQRMRNLSKQLQVKMKKGPSVDTNIGLGIAPEQKTKEQVRFAVDRAKEATASMGKYQRLAKGEKVNVKTGKKRKFMANEAGGEGEKSRSLDILNKLKAKKAKIVEEKVLSVAGPEKKEKKENKSIHSKPSYQKSQMNRQQWFKNKKDNKSKKNHGNTMKGGKAKASRK